MKVPVSFFDNRPVGDFIARVENDSEKVRFLFSELSVRIIGNLLFFMGVIAVIIYKSPDISVWILSSLTVLVIGYNYFMRYVAKLFKKVREKYSEVTAKITEYVQGMGIIQIFHKEKEVVKIIEDSSAEKKRIETKAAFVEYTFEGFFMFLIEYFFLILIIILLAPKIFDGSKSIGTLIIFSQYINRIVWPLIQLLENVMQIQKSFVSLNRIQELNELPVEPYYNNTEEIKGFKESIEFKNVWFAYEEDKWILKDVSFKINKGDKVALVGPSGSGKTTTVSLLCGFYTYQKGTILVDGKPLNKLNIKKWRRELGLILQDVFLFPGDIVENVRIYNDAISEDSVKNAIKMVHADKFLQEGALSKVLSERGQNISQGEKQLLSFARALAFNPEIVIMDEATSSIDTVTEAKIQDSMTKLLANKTALIVAHRLSSIIDADNIIYFENGLIKHQGTHDELMSSSEEYQNLVNLQFVGGSDE
jgi:ABC-type multidrug transport system fused ATPase/permease subunit